jgi:hypothetical protein
MPSPIGKYKPDRRIDRSSSKHLGVSSGDGAGFTAPPVPPAVPAPGTPTLATSLVYSAVTPAARIDASWSSGLEAFDLEYYVLQISTDSTFATDVEVYATAPNQQSISIDNRRVATTYYVRVRTIVGATPSEWGASASITTPVDTTPPSPVTGAAASFIGTGDLVVSWTPPTSTNFKDVEAKIYASNGGALLATLYSAVPSLVWTTAQNLAATSQVGDPTVYVELRARSWGAVFSTIVAVSATKAAPTAPTVTVDFTGVDAVYTLTPPTDAAYLSFVADTAVTARRIAPAGRYVYPFDQNRLDHAGTPDPSLAYSFTAVDGLNQASTATSGTATNAAPSAPTVTLIGGFSQLVCSVTSAPATDFAAYEYVWKRDGATVLTLESAGAEQQYATGAAGDEGTHSWTCTVRQKDAFAQYSAATASSAVVLDTLTISYLRAGLIYTDSISTTLSALAVLKDDVKASGGISYAA